jgi:hypothetical protein
MDASTAQLFAVVALLGVNNIVFRMPGWERRPIVFWGLQLFNMATIVYLLAFGIPGFSGVTTAINWVLGLLFILHVVTNNGRYIAAVRAGSPDTPEYRARRAQMQAALRRGEE